MAIRNISIEEEFEPLNQEIRVEARVSIWRENYGEDADGNRGVMTTFCEVDEILIYDENSKDITNMFEGDFKDDFDNYVTQLEETEE